MKNIILSAALLAVASPAFAQTAQDPNAQQFVQKAAISDMFEIQSSQLALEKANNDQVKKFAKMIVDDHTASSKELKSLAEKVQGIQIPGNLDQEHQRKLEQLRSASGDQFHQLYRTEQVRGHEAAVALYDGYSKNGQNQDLKSFAQKTLPKLREHLQHAQALPEASRSPGVAATPGSAGQKAAQQSQQPQGNQRAQSASGQKAIAQASTDQILGSDLRGTQVRGANDENIGDVKDILLDKQGRLVAVIVGVGGFLGIGDKNVAIPFDSLEFSMDAGRDGAGPTGANRTNGRTGSRAEQQGQKTIDPDRIVLRGMTKADLEAAPAFRNEATTGQADDSGQQRAPASGTRGNTPRQ